MEACCSNSYIYSFKIQNMEKIKPQHISSKIDELQKTLKIDTMAKDWESKIKKELRSMTFNYKISRIVSFIFVGAFAILGLVALFADGGTVFGIEIKEPYLYVSIIVTSLSAIIINAGNMQLRMDRIKTFLFLKDLNN